LSYKARKPKTPFERIIEFAVQNGKRIFTMTSSKTYIVNDQATETDALDFTPYVETLADIIQTGNTPLTIGVFGTWGSGKTSLMKMVKNKLPNDFTVAWFDAWKYDKEETLWRAFLLSVLFGLF
jgi:predicted KAP-like P-loop ATPase